MKTFFTYTIQIYKDMTPEGVLTDYIEVQVIADSEKEALKKAQTRVIRPNYKYRLKTVTEFQDADTKGK